MATFVPRSLVLINATISNLREGAEASTTDVAVVAIPVSLDVTRSPSGIADSCSVTVEWDRLAIDPRAVVDITVTAYLADVFEPEVDLVVGNEDLVRFVGFVDEPSLTFDRDGGTVELSARSYEGRLIDTPANPRPLRIDRKLSECIREAVDAVPGYSALEIDVADDVTPSKLLGRKSFAVGGGVSIWDQITELCNRCGLIVFFDRATLRVTAPKPVTTDNTPVMIWGENVESVSLRRDLNPVQRTAVRLYCYDDVARRRLTARFPKRPRRGEKEAQIPVVGPYTQQALDRYAEAVHGQWSRTQVIGQLTTVAMRAEDITTRQQRETERSTGAEPYGSAFGEPEVDLLGLQSGSQVYVNVRGFTPTSVFGFTESELADELRAQGVEDEAADTLASTYVTSGSLAPVFTVSEARFRFDRDAGVQIALSFEGIVSVDEGDADG